MDDKKGFMKLKTFTSLARQIFDKLPEDWRSGLGELNVVRRARRHPHVVGGYTLTESVAGKEGAAAECRVYYGSFVALDSRDPEFDFELQLRESLAYEAFMNSVTRSMPEADHLQYALRENTKRLRGEAFDPLFYRFGRHEGRSCFSLGKVLFLELPLSRRHLARLAGRSLRVRVQNTTHFLRVPRVLPEPRFRRLGHGAAGAEIWAVMLGLTQLTPENHESAR